MRLDGAIFYSWIDDAIFGVLTPAYPCTASTTPPATPTPGCTLRNLTQSQNVGSGEYYGAEASVTATLTQGFEVGANYTLTKRDLSYAANPAFRPTGVPTHKALVYADWSPLGGLHIQPSVEVASSRWTLFTATPTTQPARYVRTGSYVSAAIRIEYSISDKIDIGIGARNILDEEYSLTDGFPEPGRTLFATVRARY